MIILTALPSSPAVAGVLKFSTSVKSSRYSSIFAGTGIEVMKTPFRGAKGHIGIKTNFIERAKAYLEMQGFEFDPASANVKDGQLKAIYLKDEIAGFAIHLVQK